MNYYVNLPRLIFSNDYFLTYCNLLLSFYFICLVLISSMAATVSKLCILNILISAKQMLFTVNSWHFPLFTKH